MAETSIIHGGAQISSCVLVSADQVTVGGDGSSLHPLHVIPGSSSPVATDGTSIAGNGTAPNPLHTIVGGTAVATDATLTGNGTTGSPLHVVGSSGSVVTDGTSITGNGTIGSPLHTIAGGTAVVTDTTLTGSGTSGNPLSAIQLVTNVATFGATGDGVTDDHAAITAAIANAQQTGRPLYFPRGAQGRYRSSLFLYFNGFVNFEIIGNEATVLFPSDDVTILGAAFPQTASAANPNTAARSGFFFDHCTNVRMRGVAFEGGSAQEVTTVNVGSATYLRHCVSMDLDYHAKFGAAPLQQEATTDTAGTGLSLLSGPGGVVTVTALPGSFLPGFQPPRMITIANAQNLENEGTFPILALLSDTQLTFQNPGAISETSSFFWSVDDHDRLTSLTIHGYGCRAPITPCPNSSIDGDFSQPSMSADMTGIGDSIQVVGTTVVLRDVGLTFPLLRNIVGKYAKISGAQSAANNGWFQITAATPATLFTPGSLTLSNPAGVAEEHFSGTWWIMNGDVTGIGAGAGAIDVTAGIVTFTSSQNAFTTKMIGMSLRLADTTTLANAGNFAIRSVPAPNQVTFANPIAVSESFDHGWGIDSYDSVIDEGLSFGSGPGIYLFAGRSNVQIHNMSFHGIRADAIKVSGSSASIQNTSVSGCTFTECASAFEGGADDSQAHIGLSFMDNQVLNCGIGRPGWSKSFSVSFLGSEAARCRSNQIHYSRNAIASVDGRNTVAGNFSIVAGRFQTGLSQPVSSLDISSNQITADLQSTTASQIVEGAIRVYAVGLRAYYNTAGTLSGPALNPITGLLDVMTLTDPDASFNQALVNNSIELVFCAAPANNVTSIIGAVTGSTTLTFTNPAGVAGSIGTYRIQGPTGTGQLGTECLITNNEIHAVGQTALSAQDSTAPHIVDNVIGGVITPINASGSLSPMIARNRRLGVGSVQAGIIIDSTTSWPIVGTNPIAGSGTTLGSEPPQLGDIGIGVDSTNPVDHPLLGGRGRVLPTDARDEVVFAFGSNLVDGDSFKLNGSISYTYKKVSPVGHQFNSFAGLLALINADGFVATDYGAGFAIPVVTGHMRIRTATPQTTDNNVSIDTIHVLNPTAIVVLRNAVGGGEAFCSSRGSGSAGPTPDKAVVWSPACTWAGGVSIRADNASAQALLAANGSRSLKNSNDAGCCEVITMGTTAGTEEFRWAQEVGG